MPQKGLAVVFVNRIHSMMFWSDWHALLSLSQREVDLVDCHSGAQAKLVLWGAQVSMANLLKRVSSRVERLFPNFHQPLHS